MWKFYKAWRSLWFMDYDDLLDEAYEQVEVNEEGSCERFEVLKVTGHHEGIRTVITNFLRVCECLRRRPEHVLKFLGKELGLQGEISGERALLSRKVSSKEINAKVERYAKRFVICPKCGKPDTELDGDEMRCLACGAKNAVH